MDQSIKNSMKGEEIRVFQRGGSGSSLGRKRKRENTTTTSTTNSMKGKEIMVFRSRSERGGSSLLGQTTTTNCTNPVYGEEDKSKVVTLPKINSTISGHSTPGLLTRTINSMSIGASFMYLTESGQIQISDFSHKFKRFYWSGCNGFMLESCPGSSDELMITNPSTNQCLHLPPFIDPTQPSVYRSAIAYVATRKEYKVVRTYYPVRPHTVCPPPPTARMNCAILTVGVDNAWRIVDTHQLSPESSQQLSMLPLVTEGFVHWAHDWYIKSSRFVLTLNMKTETITRYEFPPCAGGFHYYKYFSTGEKNLSLLIARGYLKWNVWEMKSETGRWKKLLDIDLEAHRALLNESYDREEGHLKLGVGDRTDCKLFPAGWLKYRAVIVFVVYRPIKGNSFGMACLRVAYNVQTGDITLIQSDHQTFHPYLFHRDNQLIIHGMQDRLSLN